METTTAFDRLNLARQFRWLAELHTHPLPADALSQLLGEQAGKTGIQSHGYLSGGLLTEPISACDLVCKAVAQGFLSSIDGLKELVAKFNGSTADANLKFAFITDHLKKVEQIQFYRHGPYASAYVASCWLLADALENEHRAVLGTVSVEKDGGGEQQLDTPSLTDNEIKVLHHLHALQPKLCTYDEIEKSAHLSRGTVGKCLIKLINAGLACRPRGNRQGATLTDQGRAVIALLGP